MNKVSGLLISELHAPPRPHSWYLQSSRVQGENDRFASNRAAVNKVVKTIQIVTVAMISGRMEFGSSKRPAGIGVTVPLRGDSAMVVSFSLWQMDSTWSELSACKKGKNFTCSWKINNSKHTVGDSSF